jgi:hypothetical protein
MENSLKKDWPQNIIIRIYALYGDTIPIIWPNWHGLTQIAVD